MICPKCKKEISDKILRCNHCNFKVATLCKFCGAYNSIYNEKCIDCGKTLIKFCPKCNSANFPEAKKCRKCGFEFSDKEITSKKEKITDIEEIYSEQVENGKFAKDEEKNIHFKITNKTYSQGEAKDELVKALGNKRYKV